MRPRRKSLTAVPTSKTTLKGPRGLSEGNLNFGKDPAGGSHGYGDGGSLGCLFGSSGGYSAACSALSPLAPQPKTSKTIRRPTSQMER
jgi:hypothetical protein